MSNPLEGRPQKTHRAVYETGKGRLCPECSRPEAECRCQPSPGEPVPARLTCALHLEKTGRGGKTVTVIDGLPDNRPFVATLAAELKRACGVGGTSAAGTIEIQGDQRARLRPLLAARGFRVKG